MIETKLVQKFGNSGHIVLPKGYVGKRVRFVAEPKTFEDIKSKALEILKLHLETILGIYLYGSYARNEQAIDSDVDILVVTSSKIRISGKADGCSIVSLTPKELEDTLKSNAILVVPIIREAKTIINPELLEKYAKCRFTKKNTKLFMDSSKRILELNKKGLELGFEIGSLAYSLMLRIRGLLMIKLLLDGKPYSKASLFAYLENKSVPKNKIEELHRIYSKEKNGVRVSESNIIKKYDIAKLLIIAGGLLKEASNSLR